MYFDEDFAEATTSTTATKTETKPTSAATAPVKTAETAPAATTATSTTATAPPAETKTTSTTPDAKTTATPVASPAQVAKKEDAIKKFFQANFKGAISSAGVGIIILLVVWVLAGIAAFVMSIICFGRSGSTSEKVVGVLLALLFGPFYFIYYGFNNTYCGTNQTTYMYGGKKK